MCREYTAVISIPNPDWQARPISKAVRKKISTLLSYSNLHISMQSQEKWRPNGHMKVYISKINQCKVKVSLFYY